MDTIILILSIVIVAQLSFLLVFLWIMSGKQEKFLRKMESNIVMHIIQKPITLNKLTDKIESLAKQVKDEVKKSKEELSKDGRI